MTLKKGMDACLGQAVLSRPRLMMKVCGDLPGLTVGIRSREQGYDRRKKYPKMKR